MRKYHHNNPLISDTFLSYNCALQHALAEAQKTRDYTEIERVMRNKEKYDFLNCDIPLLDA